MLTNTQITALIKEYEPLRDKRLLMEEITKIKDWLFKLNAEEIKQISKSNIAWLSKIAKTRLIQCNTTAKLAYHHATTALCLLELNSIAKYVEPIIENAIFN